MDYTRNYTGKFCAISCATSKICSCPYAVNILTKIIFVIDTVRSTFFQDFHSTIKIQHTKGYVEFFKLLPTFFL